LLNFYLVSLPSLLPSPNATTTSFKLRNSRIPMGNST
jgi:hypothetical protein